MMMNAEHIVRTLLDLTDRLRGLEQLEDQLQATSDGALSVLPAADHSSLRILNTSAEQLLCAARSGEGIHTSPVSFKRGEGVIGWVVESGRPALVNDTSSDDRFVEKSGQVFGVGSVIAVPVFSGQEVIGVLSAAANRVEAFTNDELLLTELIANSAAPHIARARAARIVRSEVMDIVDI